MTNPKTALSVMVFPGLQTLPLYAAQRIGAFTRADLAVDLVRAPNSEEQRQGLAAGRYQIAHGAADQAVALHLTGVPVSVVMGGDDGFNHLFVQRDIADVADLRGRTLVADVANTGWSFVLYEILRRHGISFRDCKVIEAGAPFRRFAAMRDDPQNAAAILNPPFAFHAQRAGLRDLGPVTATIGRYQGQVPYVLRSWAARNRGVLVSYLRACLEGLRWVLDPTHRAEAIAMTVASLDLPADIAQACYERAIAPDGLAREAALDREGFEQMLALRARFTERVVGSTADYVDLSFYNEARC